MILAAIALASQATGSFAPPIDRPITVRIETVRTQDGTTRRFTGQRTLRFAATDTGYRVAVTLDAADPAEAESDPAGLLRAGFARLAGRIITLSLGPDGTVTAIADSDTVWRALTDGIAAMAPSGTDADTRQRAAQVRAIAAALAAQPEPARRSALATLVAPLIAPHLVVEAASPGPPRTVQLPATSPFGRAELTGLRTVRQRDAMVELSLSATGAVGVSGSAGEVRATVAIERLQRVDPATGLVIVSRERIESVSADGRQRSERVTITRLEL
ncbi:hypothetical protein [Sphingomonas sp.]|uniref:hypothetical protein n=1 Tax=Sphingomonas sp. TaxID=28214 RepID=UPI00307E2DC7